MVCILELGTLLSYMIMHPWKHYCIKANLNSWDKVETHITLLNIQNLMVSILQNMILEEIKKKFWKRWEKWLQKKDGKKSHKTHDVCHGHKGFSSHKSSTSRSKEVVHGNEEKHEKSSAMKCFKWSHSLSMPLKKDHDLCGWCLSLYF